VAQGQSAKGWRYDPVPVEGQVGINFEPTQLFDIREIAARRHKYPYEHRFWVGVNFGRDLLTTRAKVEYREVLQISLHYLFVKSFNDLLAAVSVSKSGYPFQSWPLIRGGFEAAELMDYLHRYPEDTVKWINKEERFNSLTWLRHELPKSELIPILPDGAMHWTACPEFIQGCHHTRRSQIELVLEETFTTLLMIPPPPMSI
jgi:hypothetical protein